MVMRGKKHCYAIPSVLVLALILIITGLVGSIPNPSADGAPSLPRVGSKEKLQQLLNDCKDLWSPRYEMFAADGSIMKSEAVPAPAVNQTAENSYSSTNTQVAGVDEADLVKTDGRYIYQVSGSSLFIIQAVPADRMQVVAKIKASGDSFTPQEIYVDAGRLVMIGQDSIEYSDEPNTKQSPSIYPPVRNMNTTRALIYDITNRSQPVKTREITLEGSYLSSRKIGSSLYLVSNRYINPYWIMNDDQRLAPAYMDSVAGDKMTPIAYDRISYFPGCVYPNYVLVAGLNLDANRPVEIESYLGNGENIYASTDHLYIALEHYNHPSRIATDSAASSSQNKTLIHCFKLADGSVQYAGQGEVPGRIINQFSMDEFQGRFRIATTTGEVWSSGPDTSKNNIYVLDENLKTIGKLEGIAPGEKIYSTRFMGNRAYMVTFRKVDPFFVIDLSSPEQPVILGKLKIPGFSDYLHPYDENHILGFGKDTVEVKNPGGNSQAYYQGLKVALFDVSDVSNPVEMSRQIIGDRGSDSELLTNHKALLFSRDKNLLAFPVTIMEKKAETGSDSQSATSYGSFAFQGAYVYRVDLQNGLQFKGRITHLSSDDYLKAGDYWYNSDHNIQRILFINSTLYTLSNSLIEAHQLPDLNRLGSLALSAA